MRPLLSMRTAFRGGACGEGGGGKAMSVPWQPRKQAGYRGCGILIKGPGITSVKVV